ncbi:Hsp70 family protein [Dactylosporangium sp. CA-139114]|uniref:Hsp70 family protein n=1 Tax=Dactylosporangium sp. CA-139114 TaxID=3239931 RepID=UPI003D989931
MDRSDPGGESASMPPVRLAVDYGTSHTVAVWQADGGLPRPLLFDGTPLLASAVFADADGRLATGVDATRGARLDPAGYEPHPKRRIDEVEVFLAGQAYPVVDLVAMTLRRVAAEAARVAGPVRELVMTCPVAWGPARRAVLSQAAVQAGLPSPAFVTEPVAAAAYFAGTLDAVIAAGSGLVVYDLGGGTFDVCVVRCETVGFEPLAHRGLDDFGGIDLDALVVGRIGAVVDGEAPEAWKRLIDDPANRRYRQGLWDDARQVKEALSRQPQAALYVPVADREVHVTREEFEQVARPLLERTVQVTLATLREARVSPPDLAGLFLVGGATRTPLVATLLHRGIGVVPTVLEQPETVVAQGALLAAAAAGAAHAPAAPSRFGPLAPAPEVAVAAPPAGPARAPVARRRRPLAGLLAPALGAGSGLLTVTAAASPRIREQLYLSVAALTTAVALSVIAAGLAAAVSMRAGRSIPRLWSVLCSGLLMSGSAVTALAGSTGSAGMFATGRVLGGVGTGGLAGLAWVLSGRFGARAGLARRVLLGAAVLAAGAGPLVGAAIDTVLPWRWTFILATCAALVALLVAAVAVPSRKIIAAEAAARAVAPAV